MMMNVGKICREIVEMIGNIPRAVEEASPAPKRALQSFKIRVLEDRIKAIIQEKVPDLKDFDVAMSPDGIVRISGAVKEEHSRSAVEQEIRAFSEVQGVVNMITIIRSQDDL